MPGKTVEAAAPKAGFTPEETAQLVLLWAKRPKADGAELASQLSREIGRPVGPDAVLKELGRLSLTGTAANASVKTK